MSELTQVIGDIWETRHPCWRVIPTNIGWKQNGENVMGRGLAAMAKDKYPSIARFYGAHCKKYGHWAPITSRVVCDPDDNDLILDRLVFFPTKELNEAAPAMSWKNESSLRLIERSAQQLLLWAVWGLNGGFPVYVPLVGCGNGGLRREAVMPILEEVLGRHPDFILIEP
jgi:hypothetical protein